MYSVVCTVFVSVARMQKQLQSGLILSRKNILGDEKVYNMYKGSRLFTFMHQNNFNTVQRPSDM